MIFYGPMVVSGDYAEPISNLNVLRTIEDMYGTAHAGAAATSSPITDIWVTPAPEPSTLLLACLGGLGLLAVVRSRRSARR
jgi:hypothetical protein